MKDYYKILAITHDADEQEIKKAYRQLVMKFHPDKNEGDTQAENNFREVQEAYEVLSHPGKRSAYNQQRWYRHNAHKSPENPVITAYAILHKYKALNRYISTLDSFHINRQALNSYILQLLSQSIVELLIKENDRETNELIIKEVIKSTYPLPFKYIQKICGVLTILAGDEVLTIQTINKYLKQRKYSSYWDKYLPLIVSVIAIALCILIYFVSNTRT